MKKLLIILLLLVIPCLVFAEWSTPVWIDDCTITVQKDKSGNITTWTETCYGEDKKQTNKRIDEYTYYGTGEVNEINQKVYDANDKIINDKTIIHNKDSNYPIIKDNLSVNGESIHE